MADAEIAILIKAVDEATATLKKIEGQVEDTNKNIQKQTEETSKTFDKQMGSILVLGQAASSVDRIFDSYENMQLRVENATDRVANAQDNLRNAQYKLQKVMEDSTSTADDVKNAEQNVESASRSLEIAQNRLAITNNQVIGTYIQIGMQSITLIQTLPTLTKAIQGLTVAGAEFGITPIGATLVAIGIAAAIVVPKFVDLSGEQSKTTEESYKLSTASNVLAGKFDIQIEKVGALKDAYFGLNKEVKDRVLLQMEEMVIGLMTAQDEMKQYETITSMATPIFIQDMQAQGMSVDLARGSWDQMTESQKLNYVQTHLSEIIYGDLNNQLTGVNVTFGDTEQHLMTTTELENVYNSSVEKSIDLNFENYKSINDFSDALLNQNMSLQKAIGWLQMYNALKHGMLITWSHIKEGYVLGFGTKEGYEWGQSWEEMQAEKNKLRAQSAGDFISRPGQPLQAFSSQDTIFGMEDIGKLKGSGQSIKIYINNINGLTGRDIAEQLQKELSKKISLG
jgi:methyl-accepting chemotaxis protein